MHGHLNVKQIMHYGIPQYMYTLKVPAYSKHWPEDGLLKPKHVAKLCIIDYILMLCQD